MASSLGQKLYSRIPDIFALPTLIDVQTESFAWLKSEGLAELFDEISPIESYNKGMKLYFPSRSPEAKQWGLKYWFGEPKHNLEECVERDLTFASPLYVSVLLAGSEIPEPIKQDIFLGDFPEMTEKGTFIVNGTERVVVSQLIRSPGASRTSRRSAGPSWAAKSAMRSRPLLKVLRKRSSSWVMTLRINWRRALSSIKVSPITSITLSAISARKGRSKPAMRP